LTSSLIKFHSILHATDFSADSERAFAHALRAAVDERSSLLVMATHGRHGLPRWFHRSVSEPIARQSRIPVLFVPHQARGFVSIEDGH
jgi:nucleotide-binding universal stress UspA family protein